MPQLTGVCQNGRLFQFGTEFAEQENGGCVPANQKKYKTHKNNTTMSNIRPLADRVIIRPVAAETTTKAGIIIPDNAKEKPLKGEVLATGKGTKDEEMVLKAGDTVLYGKYAGTEVELDGEKLLIMRQSDVLAVIE
jgi:chaperonin GroES